MAYQRYAEASPIGCLREVRRIMREVDERRIDAEEGWNRVSLVFLKAGNRVLSESDCEPVV
jgi:hypothetical protein